MNCRLIEYTGAGDVRDVHRMKHAFVRLEADSVVEAIRRFSACTMGREKDRSALSNPAMLALIICVALVS
jgi:hypothetical protein